MKQMVVTFLFFIISICSNAQDVDGFVLQNLSKKVIKLGKLKKTDSAIYYSKELLSKSIKLKDTLYILKAYNNLAKYNKINKTYFESVRYYTKSKELNLWLKDTNNAINKLRWISTIQTILGDFNSSENNAIEALKLSKSLHDSLARKHQLGLYNELGITSRRLKNLDDAIIWYNEALEITMDSLKRITIKNNIAVIDIQHKHFKKAIDSLSKLIKTLAIKENPIIESRVLDNIAFAKSKLNNPAAENELLVALKCREDINDLSGQFASNIHLSNHYKNHNQIDTALIYANNAYLTAYKLKSATSKVEALSNLIDLGNNTKMIVSAYKKLTDSISTARTQAKIQFAKIKYDTEKNREENLILKTETAQKDLKLIQEKLNRNLLISLSLLLTIVVAFIIFYWRQGIKIAGQNAIIKTENRISKKIHDEMANDISDIKTLVKNHIPSTNPSKKQIINMLNTSYISARDIATETGGVIFGDSFGETLKNLLMQHNDDNVKIITNINGIDSIKIPEYKKNAIYRALQELMVNMNKHSQATKVTIAYKKEGKHNEIRYTDNGIGAYTIQKNRGLQNTVTRMKDIGGSFNFETSKGNGFRASLKFKA